MHLSDCRSKSLGGSSNSSGGGRSSGGVVYSITDSISISSVVIVVVGR